MSQKTPISETQQRQSPDWGRLHITALEPALHIVATPIGNLRDITLRALDILASVDVILAEDTRHTQKLLSAYNLSAQLIPYHDHNVAKQIPKILERLASGQSIAQVSDAGTPLISDPGYKLVKAVTDAGYKVHPIPGSSALLAGLSGAGLPTDKFMFAGFLPNRTKLRRKNLDRLKSIDATLVFFETANRVKDVLTDMEGVLGDRQAVLARELTKKFEEFRRGSISELINGVENDPPRGEIVLMIAPPIQDVLWDETTVDAALNDVLPNMSVKEASQHVAELSGWSKRDLYQRALSLK